MLRRINFFFTQSQTDIIQCSQSPLCCQAFKNVLSRWRHCSLAHPSVTSSALQMTPGFSGPAFRMWWRWLRYRNWSFINQKHSQNFHSNTFRWSQNRWFSVSLSSYGWKSSSNRTQSPEMLLQTFAKTQSSTYDIQTVIWRAKTNANCCCVAEFNIESTCYPGKQIKCIFRATSPRSELSVSNWGPVGEAHFSEIRQFPKVAWAQLCLSVDSSRRVEIRLRITDALC